MGKSVYSLVLMDEVVEAIDQMAYQYNTSRSNLINQILAEHVSFPTPEKRMKDVFSSLEQLLDETFQIRTQPSEAMLSIRSPLRFKYNPTIRYSLELYRNPGTTFGKLKVQFRTQNADLLEALHSFFSFWYQLEEHYLPGEIYSRIQYEWKDGRFSRELAAPSDVSHYDSETLGNAIACYIKLLDEMIKLWFASLDQPDKAAAQIQRYYITYVNQNHILL